MARDGRIRVILSEGHDVRDDVDLSFYYFLFQRRLWFLMMCQRSKVKDQSLCRQKKLTTTPRMHLDKKRPITDGWDQTLLLRRGGEFSSDWPRRIVGTVVFRTWRQRTGSFSPQLLNINHIWWEKYLIHIWVLSKDLYEKLKLSWSPRIIIFLFYKMLNQIYDLKTS